MKQSKKTKIILSISLVAVLVIGATWAYMSTITNTATNVFTFEENITATLSEPEWDGGEDLNGNGVPDAAENMVPGSSVAKDPQITNTSNIDEYVAIKLTFQNGAGAELSEEDVTTLLGLITISYEGTNGLNTGQWELCDPTEEGAPVQTWYYNTLLEVAAVTDPIFDLLTINADITNDEYAWLNGTLDVGGTLTGISGFQIYVEGAAVQASVFGDAAEASTDLYTLLNPVVVP